MELVSDYSKVEEYKVNIQKLITLLYIIVIGSSRETDATEDTHMYTDTQIHTHRDRYKYICRGEEETYNEN